MKKIQKAKRDNKRRVLYKKMEIYQKIVKLIYIYQDSMLFKLLMYLFFQKKIFREMCKVRIKNYCIITGRSRGVYKKLKISRLQIRLLGASGLFFGLKKNSW